MDGVRSPAPERRRGIRRLLLHPRGEASSSSPPPLLPAAPAEEGRRRGFASAALRGLGCTSAAASQAYAPGAAAAAAVRSSADWHGRRRRKGKERRKERGGGGGSGGLVAGGIGADVWCAPGIPFAAEASSVDCVVARHQMVGRGGRAADGERSHREVRYYMAFVGFIPSLLPRVSICSYSSFLCSLPGDSLFLVAGGLLFFPGNLLP